MGHKYVSNNVEQAACGKGWQVRVPEGMEADCQTPFSPSFLQTSPITGPHLLLVEPWERSVEMAVDSQCMPSHKYFQWEERFMVL